jgi:hypothetical protein
VRDGSERRIGIAHCHRQIESLQRVLPVGS